jgi:hypothetical protein
MGLEFALENVVYIIWAAKNMNLSLAVAARDKRIGG